MQTTSYFTASLAEVVYQPRGPLHWFSLDFMWCKNVNCNSEMSLELVQDFFDIGSF